MAWAHPTTGVVQDCAPSLQPSWRKTIPGLDLMVKAGWVVVATDYPGLGTPGVHPYLVGASEARAVVDSVRAARNVKEAAAGRRFAVWGHSQGGHAAVFTGQLAARARPGARRWWAWPPRRPPPTSPGSSSMDLGHEARERAGRRGALVLVEGLRRAPLEGVLVPDAIPVVEKVAARLHPRRGARGWWPSTTRSRSATVSSP